jgi:hypothetical protein
LGVGRLLIAIYAIFAISATARASYQLIREFDQAPLAYSLSAISAVVYLLATYSLSRPDDEGLQCTSALLEDDCDPPEGYLEAMRCIYGRARNPLMVTTRDASGQVTRMDAILG